MFDLNPKLMTELTPEQAARVQGGFFKGISKKQKQLLKAAKAASLIVRRIAPPVGPVARLLVRGNSASPPVGQTLLSSEDDL